MYILLPILKLPLGMLNKDHATPAHPVSLSLYFCLKIKKASAAYHQQQHQVASAAQHQHQITSSASASNPHQQQQHQIASAAAASSSSNRITSALNQEHSIISSIESNYSTSISNIEYAAASNTNHHKYRIRRSSSIESHQQLAIGAFADMHRLPDFDEMVAHPALLVPQKIPVDEDEILPYFPNLVEAEPGEFNATPFSWHTTFRFMNSKLVLHCIFGHTLSNYHPIKRTPMTSQMIHFVTHKHSPKSVCRNRPRKIMMPVCLPWRTIYLTI
jgi:hypothetical protein